MRERRFGDPRIKEAEQDEFLLVELLPRSLIEEIGPIDAAMAQGILESSNAETHPPCAGVR